MPAPKLKAVETAPPVRSDKREKLAALIASRATLQAEVDALAAIDRWPFIETAMDAVENARAGIEVAREADQASRAKAAMEGAAIPTASAEPAAVAVLADAEKQLQAERDTRDTLERDLETLRQRLANMWAPSSIARDIVQEEGVLAASQMRERFVKVVAEALDLYEAMQAIGAPNGIGAGEVRAPANEPMIFWRQRQTVTAPGPIGAAWREAIERLATDPDTQFPEI